MDSTQRAWVIPVITVVSHRATRYGPIPWVTAGYDVPRIRNLIRGRGHMRYSPCNSTHLSFSHTIPGCINALVFRLPVTTPSCTCKSAYISRGIGAPRSKPLVLHILFYCVWSSRRPPTSSDLAAPHSRETLQSVPYHFVAKNGTSILKGQTYCTPTPECWCWSSRATQFPQDARYLTGWRVRRSAWTSLVRTTYWSLAPTVTRPAGFGVMIKKPTLL